MSRRNIELILLLVAAPVVALLFVMIAINEGQQVNFDSLSVPIGIFAAFVVAHLAVRKLAPGADPALLPLAFSLSGIGIAFITRIAPFTDAPNMAQGQVVWLFVGVGCMVAVLLLFRNLDKVANYKYTLMLAGIILLLSPLIPGLGQEIYGSKIWLHIGGFSFQPGEIAKIVIVLFMASYLAENRELLSVFTVRMGPFRLPDIRSLLPLLLMWGVAMLIVVFEKDLGSAMVFFFVFLLMLYVATGKKFYLIIGLGLMAIGGVAAFMAFSHVQVRVNTWLDPFSDAQNTGYQLCQALYSIADGDLFGVGLGNGLAGGTDAFSAIPVVESDFIFADIAEEIGLLGASGVLLLFLCFAIRGFLTAARAKSDVSSFVAVGLTSMIVLQAFIIVGGVTRVIPLTGLTLPFISQGGSSLLGSFIIVGFLLRAGDEATGIESEMLNGTTSSLHSNSVLGRISLGKRLTHSMLFCSALFAILVANLTLIMVVNADSYQSMPGNNHTLAKEAKSERGTISTYDGIVLARSVLDDDGSYSRIYPAGDLASHVVGYVSQQYGTSGIEDAYNDTLKGQENFATWTDVLNDMAGIGTTGNDVALTINSKIQQAAQDAIAGKKGAAVVMDPKTGAILAMASAPTYDAANFEQVIAAANADSSDSSLINRATGNLYAPGSTFKMVTLSTAREADVANESTPFSSPGTIDIGNASVSNFNHMSYGTQTLEQATWWSANTVYGQLGVQMGADKLVEGAERFGFNQAFDFPLVMYTSLMADPNEMTEWETAWAAAGVPVNPMNHESPAGPQATVLQMAMVGSAIANDGVQMTPYLVDGIYNANGERSFTAQPQKLRTSISAETAKRVREVLKGVVNNGTGTAARIDGVDVAGKTGTAEKNDGNDMWFVGMAPADDASIVVAVVIEDGEESEGTIKAHDILQTALEVQGLL